MTLKLEQNVKWVPFGYGMIAKQIGTDPSTETDPIIMFVHRLAVGGKYHNGAPILTAREEKKMMREVEVMINDLNRNFVHNEDFVPVGEDYNQPKKARQTSDAEIVTDVPDNLKDVSPVKAIADGTTKPSTEEKPKRKYTRRSSQVETEVEVKPKRKYTRRTPREAA